MASVDELFNEIVLSFRDQILLKYKELIDEQNNLIANGSDINEVISLVNDIKTSYNNLISFAKKHKPIPLFSTKIKTALIAAVKHSTRDVITSNANYAHRIDEIYAENETGLFYYIDSLDTDQSLKSQLKNLIENFNDKIHKKEFREFSTKLRSQYESEITKAINNNFPESSDDGYARDTKYTEGDYTAAFQNLHNIRETLLKIKQNFGTYETETGIKIYDVRFQGIFWRSLLDFVKEMPNRFGLADSTGVTKERIIKSSPDYSEMMTTINNFATVHGNDEKANIQVVLEHMREKFRDYIDKFIAIICAQTYDQTQYEDNLNKLITGAENFERTGNDIDSVAAGDISEVFKNINMQLSQAGTDLEQLFRNHPRAKTFMIKALNNAIQSLDDPTSKAELNKIIQLIS